MIHIPDFYTGEHKFICNQCQKDIDKQAKRALESMKSCKGKFRFLRYFMPGIPDNLQSLKSQVSFKLLSKTIVITIFE